jgi:hypothetical protein
MPTFWDDLSTSNPPDTESVSTGALRIRQVVDAGKSTTGIEHYGTGEHKFPIAQPSAPKTNQIWFNLAQRRIERWDGTGWNLLEALPFYRAYSVGSTVITGVFPAYTTVLSIPNVQVIAGSNVLISVYSNLTSVDVQTALDLAAGMPPLFNPGICRVIRDATPITDTKTFLGLIFVYPFVTTPRTGVVSFIDMDEAPAAGTYTYHIQVSKTLGVYETIAQASKPTTMSASGTFGIAFVL